HPAQAGQRIRRTTRSPGRTPESLNPEPLRLSGSASTDGAGPTNAGPAPINHSFLGCCVAAVDNKVRRCGIRACVTCQVDSNASQLIRAADAALRSEVFPFLAQRRKLFGLEK